MAIDNSQYTVLVVDDVPVNILLVKGNQHGLCLPLWQR